MATDDERAHHADGRFRNPWPSHGFQFSLFKFGRMLWMDFDSKQMTPSVETKMQLGSPLQTDLNLLRKPPIGLIQATWVGHATFFIQFDRLNILTDPVWSDRCSPSQWFGPKRFMPVPFPLADLPPVDVVIISHNHYDHLDFQTVKALGDRPLYLVPLGVKSWAVTRPVQSRYEIAIQNSCQWDEHNLETLSVPALIQQFRFENTLYVIREGKTSSLWGMCLLRTFQSTVLEEHFEKFTSIGINNVVELDWWQEHQIVLPTGNSEKSLRAICAPAQHGSGRGLLDKNKTLWCSWILEGDSKRIYFAGDTGFCTVPRDSKHLGGFPDVPDIPVEPSSPQPLSRPLRGTDKLPVCPAFEEVGKRFGPIDLSLIPIGAYSPRYFFSNVHASPEDAVGIHLAVGSKQSIGMHWGTFGLTDEPIMEPPLRLKKELERLNIRPETFITMKHGETRRF